MARRIGLGTDPDPGTCERTFNRFPRRFRACFEIRESAEGWAAHLDTVFVCTHNDDNENNNINNTK